MNAFRFAYILDGEVAHTDTFETGITDPQQFAEVLARLPKNGPYEHAEVWVWADPDANPHAAPADGKAVPR